MLSALTLFYFVYIQESPSVVTLHVVNIDIQHGFDSRYEYDYLFIYDGADLSSMKLAKYSSNSHPPDLQSTTGSFLLHLDTDSYGSRNGFNVSWCKFKLFLICIYIK